MGYKIGRVYSSPLKRAVSSAKIISDVFGLKRKLILDKDLRDIDIPALAGKKASIREDIHARGTDEYSDEFVKKGNESREHIVKRMKNVFDKVFKENVGKTVAIVSHGDPIRFLLYRLQHPFEEVPSMHVLVHTNYPKKAEAVKLVIDTQEKLVSMQFIR